MELAVAGSPTASRQASFEDGLGERRYAISTTNELLSVLRLSSSLGNVPSFEFALRERAARLSSFHDDSYAHVRSVEVDKTSSLVVVSDYVHGERLSTLLAIAKTRSSPLEIDAARAVIRQLLAAAAAWHTALPDISNGSIGPERIVLTPEGHVVIVEYVLGSALEQLRYSPQTYWRGLRVAVHDADLPPRFNARTDLTQIAMVVLALALGRRIAADEYPGGIRDLVDAATTRLATGQLEPAPTALREWLVRAFQKRHDSFATAVEAHAALEGALGVERSAAEGSALRAFIERCRGATMMEQVSGVDSRPRVDELRIRPRGASTSVDSVPLHSDDHTLRDRTSFDALLGDELDTNAEDLFDSEVPERSTAMPVEPGWPQRMPVDEGWPQRVPVHEGRPHGWRIALALAVVAMVVAVAIAGWRFFPSRLTGVSATRGSLSVVTNPAGVAIFVDGQAHGLTPLTLDVSPGEHVVEIVSNGNRRRVPIQVSAGAQVSQFLELPQPSSTVGDLMVRTNPPAATVSVDGRVVGQSPVSVPGLAPGSHEIVLAYRSRTVTEHVLIEDGKTASLLVSMPTRSEPSAAAPALSPAGSPTSSSRASTSLTATAGQKATGSGWVLISAPAALLVFENGRLVGSNGNGRIMLTAGLHELDIVNEALRFHERRPIQITAGQTSPVAIEWPKGSLALNALPWAEVWVDGTRVGETPIGSLPVPIGTHEIVFRHPQLGERKSSITVIAGEPARVGVDLRTQ